jgi:hypothetical protein
MPWSIPLIDTIEVIVSIDCSLVFLETWTGCGPTTSLTGGGRSPVT